MPCLMKVLATYPAAFPPQAITYLHPSKLPNQCICIPPTHTSLGPKAANFCAAQGNYGFGSREDGHPPARKEGGGAGGIASSGSSDWAETEERSGRRLRGEEAVVILRVGDF
jgi:hypothetical protein